MRDYLCKIPTDRENLRLILSLIGVALSVVHDGQAMAD